MKWVTRERPKTDRIACPWLIRRFIDPEAEILFVPANGVLAEAEVSGARSFASTTVRMVMHESRFPEKPKYAIAPPYGPRRERSNRSISSMARIFGAPVSVPAGNAERKQSTALRSLRSCEVTFVTRWMTCE